MVVVVVLLLLLPVDVELYVTLCSTLVIFACCRRNFQHNLFGRQRMENCVLEINKNTISCSLSLCTIVDSLSFFFGKITQLPGWWKQIKIKNGNTDEWMEGRSSSGSISSGPGSRTASRTDGVPAAAAAAAAVEPEPPGGADWWTLPVAGRDPPRPAASDCR